MIRVLVSVVLLGGLAPAGEPGEAALAYLNALREAPGTAANALSEHTTPEKRATIARRLQRLGERLRGGRLEVLEEKLDPPLAAALVTRTAGRDQDALQVHAIALIERDGLWRPAPLPASFENTGIRYDPELAAPAAELERWMRLRQVLAYNRLRDELEQRFAAAIRQAVEPAQLRGTDPETLVFAFLEACRDRQLPTALAYLGGLETRPPEAWNRTVQALSRQLEGPATRRGPEDDAWSALLDAEVLHTLVETRRDESGTTLDIGHFRPGPLHLNEQALAASRFRVIAGADDLPRVELPPTLIAPGDAAAEPLADSVLSRIPRSLFERHPPQPADEPADLAQRLQRALRTARFAELLALIDPADADPAEVLRLASRLWWDFHPDGPTSPLLLASHRAGDEAACLVAHFDARRPRLRPNLISRFTMQRDARGWLLDPVLDAPDFHPPEALAAWLREHRQLEPGAWLETLTGNAGVDAADGEPPAPAAARETVERWLDGARERDPARALSAAAWIGDERGADKLLRALAQDMTDASEPRILAVHSGARWAAVTVRDEAPGEDEDRELLYPVLQTPAGPRVLAEGVLYHADTRPRSFLNSATWKRLADRLPEDQLDELRQLHQAHTERSRQP